MGKKRALKDLWIAFFAIIGAILIIINKGISIAIGIILVLISIIISISKAWVK